MKKPTQNPMRILTAQVAWDDLDPDMISASCRHAQKRMEAVVEANGGYIEDKYFF